MVVDPSLGRQCEVQSYKHPLHMERQVNLNSNEHLIDITRARDTSGSGSLGGDQIGSDELHHSDGPSTSTQTHVPQSSSSPLYLSGSRNATSTRRGDNYAHRHRSPLNSCLWISVELVVNVSQIIAAIVVLSLSRNEHPQAVLLAWVIGYTIGCIASLPHLYWRYIQFHSQGSVTSHSHRGSSQTNPPESNSYTVISVTPFPRGDVHTTSAISRSSLVLLTANPRLNAMANNFKMALDCFFAVWFVLGSVWVFGGHLAVADAPKLYWLCLVFLTFSFVGYAMPFVLCAMVCCCLPCIISFMNFGEDSSQSRGAATDAIKALPTYKFKVKRSQRREESGSNSESQGDDGILAAGTDKEQTISAEDAVCCICLARYVDGDELRQLPCAHLFHIGCVDKWLKMNALCPLCKSEVPNTVASNPSCQ